MNAEDDARATWELLTETERKVLAAIDRESVVTPQRVGLVAGVTWQKVARTVRQLKSLGLVSIKSLPKQTDYSLTGQGQACLAVGLYGLTLAHRWKGLAWRGYDAERPVHAAAEERFARFHDAHGDGPDRCSCGGLMCGGCGAHYPRSFRSELPHEAAGLDSSQAGY